MPPPTGPICGRSSSCAAPANIVALSAGTMRFLLIASSNGSPRTRMRLLRNMTAPYTVFPESVGYRDMKMPAMQFYPADWRKDLAVQALGYFERGVWFEMLCLMHESNERGVLLLNGSPMSDAMVARLLGLDNQTFNQTLTTLLTYGVAKRREDDNAIYSKRMVADEKLCQIRREAGKLGGNPVLLNQNPTTGDKQNPTPSSSSSSSSSIHKDAEAILVYLNEKVGRCYKPVKANLSLIAARLEERATVDECRMVIDAKSAEWRDDPKWSKYLRPKTLFSATNFAQYSGDLGSGASTVGREGWE